ncbi:ABC-F family ATP-binding cassette domain-containing protein [Thermogemmatispora sp.]|uniref:ABC-F family ATP-binding cassette domain-containing protein n=1 Tax=Thermogemmatispora sp. TaxID=1968838 RepID=UPI001D7A23A6|nr:ABC-F family ATP-binding cassette domain-containing protein [Thermogemmatispora sp.]MBX5451540.1 ABC-F family ATP-binding cassette domain-containing protein [Thermogemmatispora sp.]
MPLISVNSLGKAFGAERLFADVTFHINERDRIGLVGPNGAGKSTLLKLLAGQEEPDEGTILVARGTRIGYLPQTLDLRLDRTLREELLAVFDYLRSWEQELQALAAAIATASAQGDAPLREQLLQRYAELQLRFEHAGGYTYEQRVQQVLDGLGFSRELHDMPIAQLSGGQQRRAALARLLLQEPDLLLLDEPTNHLDLEALEWLEDYLQTWKGALVVVEHDRYFLDKIVTRILELAFGRIDDYPGNYSKYLQLRAERFQRRLQEYEEQQEFIQRTEEFIRRYKAGQRSRQARGREKLLSRLERLNRPQQFQELRFELKPSLASGRVVLSTRGLVVGYRQPGQGSRALVQVPDLEITRGERIGLFGPNGAGKTSLLRTLIGQLPPLQGKVLLGHNVRIGYYSQTHEDLDPERTILDEIGQVAALSEESARALLARFLFEGDEVFKAIGSLSGGERSRVVLAKLVLQEPNFLVLDEPTNHLDLPSRQFLEEVLSTFSGTLLFVSHDRYFIDRLATRVWVIIDGMLRAYDGNYSDYRARLLSGQVHPPIQGQDRQGLAPGPAVVRAKTVAGQPLAGNDHGRRLGRQRQHRRAGQLRPRNLAEIEQEIEVREQEARALEAALNEAASKGEVAELERLTSAYEAVKAELEQLLAEWEQLAATDQAGASHAGAGS